MFKKYESMVLEITKEPNEQWTISYKEEKYPKETYLVAMLDYLGLEGWKLISTTHHTKQEREGESLYFKRTFTGVTQTPKLQVLINEIDQKSNQHLVQTELKAETQGSELLKQKVLKHLYDWLSKHDFVWGEPGTGVKESHYLNKMEDVTDDALFAELTGITKVSTRIDIYKDQEGLRIVLKRRVDGPWIDFSKFSFTYTQEGFAAIQNALSMQYYKLLSN